MSKLLTRPFQLMFTCALVAALAIGVLIWWTDRRNSAAFQAGIVAADNNDLKGVLKAITKLQASTQFESHSHLLKGISHWQKGEIQQALDELGSAVGHADTTVRALTCSGRIFMEGGDHANAVRMLSGALEADPKSLEAHRLLVATYYDIGAMEHVLQHIEKVIELAPDDMRPWRMRGLILKDFERFDEAVPAYFEALKLSPPTHVEQEIRHELADSLLQLRKYEDAITQLNQLPTSAEQQALLADAFLAIGEEDDASAAIAKSLELDPVNRRALQTKASVLMERNEVQEAANLLERAVKTNPLEVDLRSNLMLAYQRLGQTELANQQQLELKRLRDLQDKFHKLHIQSIQDASDVNCRVELARTSVQLNKLDAAVSWYRAALSMQPNNTAIQSELQRLLDNAPR